MHLALDYSAQHVRPPFEPTPDDARLANDVTIRRANGGEARHIVESGPLSVQDPPDGAGRYSRQITVNVQSDEHLPGIAGWAAHHGTWDEDRYPVIRVDVRGLAARDAALVPDALSLDSADLITIDNPPEWLPPERIEQLTLGYVEQISIESWTVDWHTTPAGPYRVATVDGEQRVSADDAALVADVDADDTTLLVGSADGCPWTQDPADFPLDIRVGGERMTVTAISTGSIGDGFESAESPLDMTGTWVRASDRAHTGTWSMKSAPISDGQHTDLVVQVPPGATQMSVWVKTSTEHTFDMFELYLDDTLEVFGSGDIDWSLVELDLDGASTVTFRYVKDGSVSSGADACWIDDLSFSPVQVFTVTRAVNGISKAHSAGTAVDVWTPAIAAL